MHSKSLPNKPDMNNSLPTDKRLRYTRMFRKPYGSQTGFLAGFCGFQPKKKGMYVVDVTQDGAKFPGSPFQIQIGDAEVCTASRVKVSGAMREGLTQQWNHVVINVSEAGKINGRSHKSYTGLVTLTFDLSTSAL